MENTMKNMQGGRCGPQLYLLSEESYESLKYLQDMLTLMAQIAYSEEDHSTALTLGRAELCFIFEAINTRIDDVLKRVGDENWIGAQEITWQ
jgi:hypothetical protein